MRYSLPSPLGRIAISIFLGVTLVLGFQAPVSAISGRAPADRVPVSAGVRTQSLTKEKGRSMATVIKRAKKKNKAAFTKRLKTLKKSPALVDIINRATASHRSLYLRFFAAIVSQKKANRLVKATKGKHFVISGTADRPRVLLASNVSPNASSDARLDPTISPRAITCWQGWLAFWAWWAGSEMTCVGFGTAVGVGMSPTGPMAVAGGVIAGSACSGLMGYLQQQFIDFEDACRKLPSPDSGGPGARIVASGWTRAA